MPFYNGTCHPAAFKNVHIRIQVLITLFFCIRFRVLLALLLICLCFKKPAHCTARQLCLKHVVRAHFYLHRA